ncbi:MAG: DUF6273 domain-containing protein, partial [Bacilli bacterium]|nr:DUF6273 domain-containing protein [Bacilli bacterium]
KKLAFVMPLMAISLLASCNQPAPTPDPEKYEVTCTNGVTVTNPTATYCENYETTLTVNDGTILPDEVTEVTVNEVPITACAEYIKNNDNEAIFSIDGSYVLGPINIDLGLNYVVTVTNGVTLEEGTELATIDTKYETTLTAITSESALPNSLTEVTIGGEPSTNYEYDKKSGTEATFLVEASYVTGPINIELGLNYAVTVTKGVTLEKGTEGAVPNTKYETTLTVTEGTILPGEVTVKIGGDDSSYYTYNRDSDTKATFIVEASYVTGPIDIRLDYLYQVTVTEGVTLKEGTGTIAPNTKYETTLTVNSGLSLPNVLTSVTVNGNKLTSGYDYELESGLITKANFSIDAECVTGPINIELGLGTVYIAILTASGGETITLSNTVVNTLEDYETTISFSDETYHNKNFPNAPTSVKVNNEDVTYTYVVNELKRNEATLKIDKSLLTGDVVITLPQLTDKTKWYEFSDWWNYCSPSEANDISAATEDDVGQIVGVKVYDLMHKVRLIGIDHKNAETDVNPEAHCTFEFANVITDSNGAVITHWDEDDNYNFPDSTLNNLLSNNNDCIFKTLPSGLQGAIKQVTKKVGTSKDGTTYIATEFSTKLFPLAHDEMADHHNFVAEGEGSKYQYYIDGGSLVKTPVGSTNAQEYWLRSPGTEWFTQVWFCNRDGVLWFNGIAFGAFAVAPAFCI